MVVCRAKSIVVGSRHVVLADFPEGLDPNSRLDSVSDFSFLIIDHGDQ